MKKIILLLLSAQLFVFGYAKAKYSVDFVNDVNMGTSSKTIAAAITVASSGVVINIAVSSANPIAGTVSGGGKFNVGSTATVIATPAVGCIFVNWTENGTPVSTSAKYSFTVSSIRNLVANFIVLPTDANATAETVSLYNYLLTSSNRGLLFGQHNCITKGITWTDSLQVSNLHSDIYSAVNDLPAVNSFDFIDGGASAILPAVKRINALGGIVSISYHMRNLVTGGNYADTTGDCVTQILNNPVYIARFNAQLDMMANFFNSAVDKNGVKIPIIFRPWHEHTGNWFWWGAGSCTEAEYITLWQYTYNYLVKTKGCHNLLFALAPSALQVRNSYNNRYPGNSYVDICGFDCYGTDSDFNPKFTSSVVNCYAFAKTNAKIPAITEFGVSQGIVNTSINTWFMSQFLTPLMSIPEGHKMAYALTWMNQSALHYWIPLSGDFLYNSFVDFYNDSTTLFLSDISPVFNLYILTELKSYTFSPNIQLLMDREHNSFKLKGLTSNVQVAVYALDGRLLNYFSNVANDEPLSLNQSKGFYCVSVLDLTKNKLAGFKLMK